MTTAKTTTTTTKMVSQEMDLLPEKPSTKADPTTTQTTRPDPDPPDKDPAATNLPPLPPSPTTPPTKPAPHPPPSPPPTAPPKKGFHFWALIASLCITAILGSLENTVVVTALPTIVRDLHIGHNYIWISNVFFLTSAAVQPLIGQLAQIFGRRGLAIAIVGVFTLGSGICGAARDGRTLIAGRAVQGVGSGGINSVIEMIVSDLVPLRERGNYMAVVLMVYSVGTALGPWVGGAMVDRATWRWVFLINLPIGGLALLALILFLRVKSTQHTPLRQKLLRVDVLGNTIIIGSSVAVLYALTYGGSRLPWGSARVLAPLIAGLLGMVLFVLVERSPYIREPVTPTRLFADRTAIVIFAVTFLNSALTYWVMFFLPVYFQAVLLSSASRAGVQMMPTLLVIVVASIAAVIVLTKFGRYKGLHLAGFGMLTVGLGLYSTMDRGSSTPAWVMFQVLTATGSGMVVNTALPAFQACVAESDQASATAGWAFIRSFGNIWGVAIPAAIFNNRFDQLAYRISDAAVRSRLMDGHAYEHATRSFVKQFGEPLQSELIGVFTDSLKLGWQLSTIFSGVSFLLVFLEREIPLRKELDTEFGLEDKAPQRQSDGSAVSAISSDAVLDKV